MLASIPASILNQISTELGIPSIDSDKKDRALAKMSLYWLGTARQPLLASLKVLSSPSATKSSG
jgi:hypothetical protein